MMEAGTDTRWALRGALRAKRATYVAAAFGFCVAGCGNPSTKTTGGSEGAPGLGAERRVGSTALAVEVATEAADTRPNILLIIADDLGYSDIGAFGGEIKTPNLNALAQEGRILIDHYSAAACAPSRAMLFSGTNHHLVGLGTQGFPSPEQRGQPGYEGYLNDSALSIAEILRDGGYHTYMAGKWHLGSQAERSPAARGFESSYVLLPGVSTHFRETADPPTIPQQREYRENGEYVLPPEDFYSTDFYTDKLIEYIEANRADGRPFFAFAAYTSPHWPLQVTEEFIDRYKGAYDAGYDAIRECRIRAQKRLGIVPKSFVPAPPLPSSPELPTWEELSEDQRKEQARRMEIYAAMVENLDYNIGRLFTYLKEVGEYENTFVFFQSDNGAEGEPRDRPNANNSLENLGRRGSYVGLGARWAEVSSTPFRLWKTYSTEGGVAVPAIARLPSSCTRRFPLRGVTHIMDLAPTFLELAGIEDPGTTYGDRTVHPITGLSLLSAIDHQLLGPRRRDWVLVDELFGHRLVRRDHWKLLWLGPPYGTSQWTLHDLRNDGAEQVDVSEQEPEVFASLVEEWDRYVAENGVIVANQ